MFIFQLKDRDLMQPTARRVMIIDDDPDDLELMELAIRDLDPKSACVTYIYPEEALKNLLAQDQNLLPQYIFIDINMPGLSGANVLKILRRESRFDDVIVTLYSTSMPQPVAEVLRGSGANHVFEKPVRLEAYSEIIRNIFM